MDINIMRETLRLITKQAKEDRWTSSKPSSYSDNFLWFFPEAFYRKSRSSVSILLLLSYTGVNAIQLDYQKTKIKKYAENYEGAMWDLVREILQESNFTPFRITEICLNNMSADDYFGNIIPTVYVVGRSMKTFNPYLTKNTPVKKPQRKRGYDDKGSMRPSDHLGIEYYKVPTVPSHEIDIPISTNLGWFESSPLRKNNLISSAEIERSISSDKRTEEERQKDQEIRKQIKRKKRKLRKYLKRNLVLINKNLLYQVFEQQRLQSPYSLSELLVLLKWEPLVALDLKYVETQIEEIRLLTLTSVS